VAFLYAIGLGGAGSKVIIEFAEMLRRLGISTPNIKFQIFDMAHEPEVLEALEKGVLDPEDVKLIPAYVVENARNLMFSLAKREEKRKWFPEELIPEINIRIQGGRGVERRRPLARLALHTPDIAGIIKDEISRDLEELASRAQGENIVVVIVSSLGGGFGSGTFLDVAALVRRAARDIGIPGGITLLGIFMLPYGYSSFPPAGVRVEFEEENSMAALLELHLLEELTRSGGFYEEEVGGFGKLSYTPLYDGYFLVSYGGVSGKDYREQFKKIDQSIAEMLLFLSLASTRAEETKVSAGLAINENILEPYSSVLEKLGIGKNRWKPIVMSFNVASFSLDLSALSKYFELLDTHKAMISEAKMTRQKLVDIDEKIDEKRIEIAKIEQEYANCIDRIERELRRGEGEISPDTRSLIDEYFDDILSGEVDISTLYDRIEKSTKDMLEIYFALRYLEKKLLSAIRELREEKNRLESRMALVLNDLEELKSSYASLPLYKRLSPLGTGAQLKESIKEKEKEYKELEKRVDLVDTKLSQVNTVREKLSNLIATVRSKIDPQSYCSNYEQRIKSMQAEIEDLERERKKVEDEISSINERIEEIERELRKIRNRPEISAFFTIFGKNAVEENLYNLWKNKGDDFAKLSLIEIASAAGRHATEALRSHIHRVFSKLNKPMLSLKTPQDEQKYMLCLQEFSQELMIEGTIQQSMLRGTRVILASKKDAELATGIGQAVVKELDNLQGEIRAVSVFPIIPLPCTVEYKAFVEEYLKAKERYPSLYKRLHILPINEILRKLGYQDLSYIL